MVLASGELLTVSNEKDPETSPAVVLISLGAVGILVTVTVQCEPDFCLKQVQYAATLDDISANLKGNRDSSECFCFLWRPHVRPRYR